MRDLRAIVTAISVQSHTQYIISMLLVRKCYLLDSDSDRYTKPNEMEWYHTIHNIIRGVLEDCLGPSYFTRGAPKIMEKHRKMGCNFFSILNFGNKFRSTISII